jgi:hypothetical protein
LNSESDIFIVFEVASFRVQVSAKIVVGRPIFGVFVNLLVSDLFVVFRGVTIFQFF